MIETIRLDQPTDLLGLLPVGLPTPFTTADIVAASRRSKRLAMRSAYCLSKAGAARPVGHTGRLVTYEAGPGDVPAAQ